MIVFKNINTKLGFIKSSRISKLLLAAFLFVLISCSNREMEPEQFMRYLSSKESGLIVSTIVNGVEYSAQCQIPEQACLQFNKGKINSAEDFQKLLAHYQDKLSFVLLIRDKKESSIVRNIVFNSDNYDKILNYANDGLNNDISLETTSGTVTSGLVHIESNTAMQPVLRMALSFSQVKGINEDITLVYNDKIFGNGTVTFSFSKKVFAQLPKLKMTTL